MGIRQHLLTQSQLLSHLDSLKPRDQEELVDHLLKFDFHQLTTALQKALVPQLPSSDDIRPVESSRHVDREKLSSTELDRLFEIGLEAVSEGKVAALVLAGGQASRLGSDRPKGVIPLGTGLGSRTDSLLFLQAAQITRIQQMARQRFPGSKSVITWLIMTSHSTDAATRAHLDEVLRETGLSWDQVLVFVQSEIPAFDSEGHAFLSTPTRLVTAPGGHGGIYEAIFPLIPLLERRGVEFVHVYCVDNILCRVPDLHMIGCAIDMNADCTTKVIEKKDPTELLGHVCLEQGKVRVLEYSEISRELAERRDPIDPSKLLLRDGSIANHLFTLPFLREACQQAPQMPYHMARKKIPYFDPKSGQQVQPEKPNGIKLERFMFDAFCHSKNFLVWQVPKDMEFSPLKNPESAGVDCLSTCLSDFNGPNGHWIREACSQLAKKSRLGKGRHHPNKL